MTADHLSLMIRWLTADMDELFVGLAVSNLTAALICSLIVLSYMSATLLSHALDQRSVALLLVNHFLFGSLKERQISLYRCHEYCRESRKRLRMGLELELLNNDSIVLNAKIQGILRLNIKQTPRIFEP